MSLKVGETGKIIRVAAGFDLSSNTELTLTFILPDTTTVTKTRTAGEVALGTTAITDPDLGALNANEYVEYQVEAGFLSQAGSWSVSLTYENSAAGDKFIGECAKFTVSEATCS